MNAKLLTVAVLALAVAGFGLIAGVSDDSSAAIDDGNTYDEQVYGSTEAAQAVGAVNFSDVCLVLGIFLIVCAAFCVGMAIYTKLYGDF